MSRLREHEVGQPTVESLVRLYYTDVHAAIARFYTGGKGQLLLVPAGYLHVGAILNTYVYKLVSFIILLCLILFVCFVTLYINLGIENTLLIPVNWISRHLTEAMISKPFFKMLQ